MLASISVIFSLVASPLLASPIASANDWNFQVPDPLPNITDFRSSSTSFYLKGSSMEVSIGIQACPGLNSTDPTLFIRYKQSIETLMCLNLITGVIQTSHYELAGYGFVTDEIIKVKQGFGPKESRESDRCKYAERLFRLGNELKKFRPIAGLKEIQNYAEQFQNSWYEMNKGLVCYNPRWYVALDHNRPFLHLMATGYLDTIPILSSKDAEFALEVRNAENQLVTSKKWKLKSFVEYIEPKLPFPASSVDNMTVTCGVVPRGEELDQAIQKYSSTLVPKIYKSQLEAIRKV